MTSTKINEDMIIYILSEIEERKFYKNLFKRTHTHQFCKFYRKNILQMTLEEFSKNANGNMNTISSFENGRSSNLKHLSLYYNSSNELQKKFFREMIPFN